MHCPLAGHVLLPYGTYVHFLFFSYVLCAVLKLMFGALVRAAERWRSIKITEFERRQLTAVRKELDQEYET